MYPYKLIIIYISYLIYKLYSKYFLLFLFSCKCNYPLSTNKINVKHQTYKIVTRQYNIIMM